MFKGYYGSIEKKDYIAPILLSLPVIVLPLEGLIRFTYWGFSVSALSVVPMMAYVALVKPKFLFHNAMHPCILLGLLLLIWGAAIETLHENTYYSELIRNFENLILVAVTAALIRDIRPMRIALSIWIAISTVLGIYFVTTLFPEVNIPVKGFIEASILRQKSLNAFPLDFYWNSVCYLVGIGGICAFGIFLERRHRRPMRMLLIFCTISCLLGTSVLLYRGPILMQVLAMGYMFISNVKDRRSRASILTMIFILAVSLIFLPQALPERFEIKKTDDYESGYLDPRVKIYTTALRHMPEYFLSGIGAGRYYKTWGLKHDLKHHYYQTRDVYMAIGLHNVFLQFFVFYGIVALLLFFLLVLRVGRILYNVRPDFPLYLTMRGLAVAAFVIIMLSQCSYAKELGLILGMLIAAENIGSYKGAYS